MVMCQLLCGNGYVSTAAYEWLLCQWLRINGFCVNGCITMAFVAMAMCLWLRVNGYVPMAISQWLCVDGDVLMFMCHLLCGMAMCQQLRMNGFCVNGCVSMALCLWLSVSMAFVSMAMRPLHSCPCSVLGSRKSTLVMDHYNYPNK